MLLVPFEDSSDVESDDVLLLPGNKTIVRWSPDSIVPPNFQAAFAVTNDYNVDISLYQLDLLSKNYVFIGKLANNIPNTGLYEITMPSFNLSESFTTAVIGVSLSEQFASRSSRFIHNAITKLALRLLKSSPKTTLIIIGASLFARAACAVWHSMEDENIGEEILGKVPPCPPNVGAFEFDERFTEDKLSLLHPGAFTCYRQKEFTRYVYICM